MNIYYQVLLFLGSHIICLLQGRSPYPQVPGQDTMFMTEVKMQDAAIRVEGDFYRAASRLSDITHKSKENHWVSPFFWAHWVAIDKKLVLYELLAVLLLSGNQKANF